MIGRMLEEKGLSLNDVELAPLGGLGSVLSSLQSGQIDAAILNEPNPTKAEKAGYGKAILPVADVIDYQTSAVFFSPKLNSNEELAVKFMKAYIKCCNYYYDAVLERKDGKPGKNYDEVIQIIAKYTNMPIEDIKLGLPYIDRNGELLASDISTQIKWYNSHKFLEKDIDPTDAVNTGFFAKALAK
jgi:NitT/TauT family transport system substrate-binding protein